MRLLLGLYLLLIVPAAFAQSDMCTNNAARNWWDVQRYDLQLEVDTGTGKLQGYVEISAKVPGRVDTVLQLDLHERLHVLSVSAFSPESDSSSLPLIWERHQEHYLVKGDFSRFLDQSRMMRLKVVYAGIPPVAVNAPWDGGIVMKRDEAAYPWIGMACQGQGAYVWFPCKNFQADEPDKGMSLAMLVPGPLMMISNGRCLEKGNIQSDGERLWKWEVSSSINPYNITFYIGDYVHWEDSMTGIEGRLDLDFYVLRGHESAARKQFEVIPDMLHCFEAKIGAYPFYRDGYKLVEAPYLGMEHQSAVAYGNGYQMGYKGEDRSRSGVGLLFDFIIVHETAHEWFGNSITAADKADMWVHEGFTSYAETIFIECKWGREQAFAYQRGKRALILNDRPVQGTFDACDEGSGDHYDKAAFLLHMMRQLVGDEPFFSMLKRLNDTFSHKVVSGEELERFINHYFQRNFTPLFDQYLRHAGYPELYIRSSQAGWQYRWRACVSGFDMPVQVVGQNGTSIWLYPSEQEWKPFPAGIQPQDIKVGPDFLAHLEIDS